jgi:hypothetical protein
VTSGCIRASTVDGFSYNFRCAVVEECTFDRGQASHAMSLFDEQMPTLKDSREALAAGSLTSAR